MSLANGRHFRIEFATRSDGTQPARDSWQALSAEEQAPFRVLFQRICDHRVIHDREKFKQLEDKIYEFKCNARQLRIACFFGADQVIYLTNVFAKKENQASPREVQLAKQVRLEHLARFVTVSSPEHRKYGKGLKKR